MDKAVTVKIHAPGMTPKVREANGKKQLVIPVSIKGGNSSIEVDLKW